MRAMFSKKLQNEEGEGRRERRVRKGKQGGGGRKINNLGRNLRSKENKIRYRRWFCRLEDCVCVVAVSAARRRGRVCSDKAGAPGGAAAHNHEYSHCGLP